MNWYKSDPEIPTYGLIVIPVTNAFEFDPKSNKIWHWSSSESKKVESNVSVIEVAMLLSTGLEVIKISSVKSSSGPPDHHNEFLRVYKAALVLSEGVLISN